jgi:hypothetical protein
MQEQVNARGMDFREKADQVLKAAAQTVDRPGHYYVELATGRCLMKGIELRPFILALGAGNAAILVHPYDLPTGALSNLTELAFLVGSSLVEG